MVGAMHANKPADLVVGLMHETLARNEKLDPQRIDGQSLPARAASG